MTCRSSTTRPAVISFKVVYYGPGLCARRRTSRTSNSVPARRQRQGQDDLARHRQTDRTLFFDFLPVSALGVRGFTTRFQLYTVPGQTHYNMTRKLVLRGVDRAVFVADSQWDRLRDNVESFPQPRREPQGSAGLNLANEPRWCCSAVFNKRDLDRIAPVDYLEFLLNRGERRVPTFEAVAVGGTGALDTLQHGVAPGTRQRVRSRVREAGA